MTAWTDCGKIVIRDGWVICPTCGRGKLQPVLPTTTARDLPRKCKRCGVISKINIDIEPEPERLRH